MCLTLDRHNSKKPWIPGNIRYKVALYCPDMASKYITYYRSAPINRSGITSMNLPKNGKIVYANDGIHVFTTLKDARKDVGCCSGRYERILKIKCFGFLRRGKFWDTRCETWMVYLINGIVQRKGCKIGLIAVLWGCVV